MKQGFLLLSLLVALSIGLQGQGGTYYGLKGGLTLGTQQWNGFDRAPLIGYHGIASIESYSPDAKFSLFAQLGYHLKGSAIRRSLFGNPFNAGFTTFPPQKFEFHNVGLTVGAKQTVQELGRAKVYYMFGVRGDYTLTTNLDEYESFVALNPNFAGFYPLNVYYNSQTLIGIRRLNYGFTAGGGFLFPFSDFIEGVLEFTINPDFSLQYEQPSIPNVRDPFTGQSRTISERKIRNLTFEVSVGARFLRKIEYID